jgi:23S rRNA pseudouridine2457 synthase
MPTLAFFKPYGVLSSFTHEEGETDKPTLSGFNLPRGVYAAGRLDFDSEGLLILSDDGTLIHMMTDPRFKLPKTYWVQIEGTPTAEQLEPMQRGLPLRVNGVAFTSQPCQARILAPGTVEAALGASLDASRAGKPITPHGPTAWLEVVLTEGKKRQVRRMTAAIGLPTVRLLRVATGPVALSGLQPGQHRVLTARELATIMQGRRRGRSH